MTPRSETRDRIVEEAARLFHERGYSATGISTILDRAGVNSGSLYHFFPGKEALLIGVLERHLAQLEPVILRPAESTTEDPLERVFALLEGYRRGLLVSGFARGCPVGNLSLELGDRVPRVRSLIDEYFSRWVTRVSSWLAQAEDRLPVGLDRNGVARLVLAVMEGALMQARTARDLAPYDHAVAQLRAHFRLLEDYADREIAEGLPAEEVAVGRPESESARSVAEAEAAEPSGWRYW